MLRIFSRQAGPEPGRRDAKNAKFGLIFSFAALAPLRESFQFGCGFAALVSVVNIPSR
jgi:hypothetical protein